jgi:ankyrin repeat domain-containing protein 17
VSSCSLFVTTAKPFSLNICHRLLSSFCCSIVALTIAADKGHHKFVELLLLYGATIDVRNKKGATPLWLACNNGHLEVVQLLVARFANTDCNDLRKVSCLMAAFRKGHIKVVKYLVRQVRQYPSDADCRRLIGTITDKVEHDRCTVSYLSMCICHRIC